MAQNQKKKSVLTPKTVKTKKKQPLATEVGVQKRQEKLESINKKLAHVDLEAAYRQYTDLYDFAPVGYFTLARNGAIHQVNLAGANLLGVKHDEVTRVRLAAFVSSASRSAFNVFFEKLLSGEGKETCELAFEKKGDGLFWARLEATCFEGSDVCRAMLTDITERKRIASLLQARVRISEFADLHTFDELLQKTLDEAEALTGSQVGFAYFLKADQKTLQLQIWSTNTLANMRTAEGKDRHYFVDEAGVWADCVSTRAPLVHNGHPNLPASRRKGLPDGYTLLLRELVVPILRNNLIVMIMGVGNKSTDYNDNDVETLSQLANLAWDTVQRKQAEELLKESEWRNRVVSELTTDYIFVVDVDPGGILKLRWASDNLFRLTGRTIEDAATSNLWGNIIHPDDRKRFFGFINQTLSTAEAGELECRTFHKYGGERWVRIFVRPQVGEGNIVTSIVGAIQDITERKRADEQLQESEKRFRNLVETTSDWIWEIDANGVYTYASPRIHEILGFEPSEIIGKKPEDFMPPEEAQRVLDIFTSIFAAHSQFANLENKNLHKDGRVIILETSGLPIVDNGGVFCGYRGIDRDITERKQAEEALKASTEFANNLIASMQDGVSVLDKNGVHMDVNSALCRMTGFSRDELVGNGAPHAYWPPEEYEHIQAAFQQTLENESSSFELIFLRKNGERFPVIVSPFAIKDSLGNIVGYSATVKDITERKQAEEALEKSEALYHNLVETSQDLIWQCDAEGRYTYLNPAWEQVLGYKTEEMIGKKFTDFQTTEMAARDQKEFVRLIQGNTVKGLETIHIGKSGKEIQLVFNAKFLTDENGKVRGTQGTAYDITERKRAEQALRESESLYRKMNENSPLGMHFYKLDNNDQLIFVGANPAADKLLGVDNSQFIGKTIEEAFPPLIQTEVPGRYRDAAAKGIPWSTEQIAYEDRQITGAFEVRAFQTSSGNMVAVFADITERKRTEQALGTANHELQTALALQQQLAHTDSLTGINNRRHLYELAEHEFEIATRYQQPLSVIMFDIDHFKQVNDTFGHTAGDQILQRVTQVACAELRSADVIGRYGGEEFVIILPMTNARRAYPLAERIRAGVAAMRVPTEKGDAVVTLSIGIVEMTHDGQTASIEVMIHNADEAMYAAKQAGRNRTEIGNL